MKSSAISNGAVEASTQYNALRDDARGGASLLAHNQLGILALPTNPSNGQTITLTVNGTGVVLTGKTGSLTTAGDFKIQATAALTTAVVLNFFQNPQQTNSTQVALSLANQQLLSYVGYALNGTNITIFSFNTLTNTQLTSFSASTTATGGSWTASTMKLYVEPGVFYVGITQVNFAGNNSPAFVAPVTNPRIDILTIDSSGTVAITQGSESASPAAPTYPTNKIVVCEVYNVVGETEIRDNANQSAAQGYISKDARGFQSVFYIGDNSQIAAGVILASNLGNAGTIASGHIVMWGGAAGSPPAGFLECDGSAVSRSTYSVLFGVIGTTFGTGDGSTTFNLPDFRTRVPGGYKSGDSNFGSVGATGGEVTHTLTASEIPAHTHTIATTQNLSQGSSADVIQGGTLSNPGSVTTSSGSGGGGAHNNLQPFLTVVFHIKT